MQIGDHLAETLPLVSTDPFSSSLLSLSSSLLMFDMYDTHKCVFQSRVLMERPSTTKTLPAVLFSAPAGRECVLHPTQREGRSTQT